jgi:hypothetical protein
MAIREIVLTDSGFAAFMRGFRDGREVDWDVTPVPADAALPASEAIVKPGRSESRRSGGEARRSLTVR